MQRTRLYPWTGVTFSSAQVKECPCSAQLGSVAYIVYILGPEQTCRAAGQHSSSPDPIPTRIPPPTTGVAGSITATGSAFGTMSAAAIHRGQHSHPGHSSSQAKGPKAKPKAEGASGRKPAPRAGAYHAVQDPEEEEGQHHVVVPEPQYDSEHERSDQERHRDEFEGHGALASLDELPLFRPGGLSRARVLRQGLQHSKAQQAQAGSSSNIVPAPPGASGSASSVDYPNAADPLVSLVRDVTVAVCW